MIGLIYHGMWLATARGFGAHSISQLGEAPNLVERDPIFHAIPESLYNHVRVMCESVDGDLRRPSAPVFKRLRQVPVEHRYPRRDLVFGHGIEKPMIKIHPCLIDLAITHRVNAGPRDRETIMAHAKMAHECKVVLKFVIVVARDIELLAIIDFAGNATELVPHGLTLPVFKCSPFDLRSGCGNAPYEIGRERTRIGKHSVLLGINLS